MNIMMNYDHDAVAISSYCKATANHCAAVKCIPTMPIKRSSSSVNSSDQHFFELVLVVSSRVKRFIIVYKQHWKHLHKVSN